MPGKKMKGAIRAALADMDVDKLRDEIRAKHTRRQAAAKARREAAKR